MNKIILLIEDSQAMSLLIRGFLESTNFNIVIAKDGASGLRLAKKLQPELILCNIVLPKLDGYEVLKRLRQDSITAKIPFIFLTASTDLESLELAERLGADDYLAKPFDRSKLLGAIAYQLLRLAS